MVSGRAVTSLLLAVVMLAVVQTIVPSMAAEATSATSEQARSSAAAGGLLKSTTIFTLADGSIAYARAAGGPLTYTMEYTGLGEVVVVTYTNDLSEVVEISMTTVMTTIVPEQASFYSEAVNVSDFGSVQFQVSAEVSDTTVFSDAQFFVGGSNVDAPRQLSIPVVITWTPQFSNAPISGTCANATEWSDAQTYQLYDYPDFSATPGVFWREPVIRYVKTTGHEPMGFETTVRGQCVRLRSEIDTTDRTFFPRAWARAINRK